MSMPYTFGKRTGGAADAKYTLRAPASREIDDLRRGRAADDGVVHQQHVLAAELQVDQRSACGAPISRAAAARGMMNVRPM